MEIVIPVAQTMPRLAIPELLENASEAMLSCTPGDGRLIEVNAQCERLLGKSRLVLLGQAFAGVPKNVLRSKRLRDASKLYEHVPWGPTLKNQLRGLLRS